LVVSVTSGYASVELAAQRFLSRFMGTADAMITHQGDSRANIPESVVEEIRNDPDVKRVTGRLELENGLVNARGEPSVGRAPQVNRVMIDLKTSASLETFVARWEPRLAQIDPGLKIRLARDNRKELDRNLQGIHILSYLGGTVSMLAATFIVFSALSMGVSERSRTLAMLRAIGAVRWQIGRLVIAEGLLLASIGVTIGVPLGWLWMKLLSLKF